MGFSGYSPSSSSDMAIAVLQALVQVDVADVLERRTGASMAAPSLNGAGGFAVWGDVAAPRSEVAVSGDITRHDGGRLGVDSGHGGGSHTQSNQASSDFRGMHIADVWFV